MGIEAELLGRFFRELREKKNLSQERLGELAGIHRTYVGKIERGEKDVSLVMAMKLAAALGTGLSPIVRSIEKENEQNA